LEGGVSNLDALLVASLVRRSLSALFGRSFQIFTYCPSMSAHMWLQDRSWLGDEASEDSGFGFRRRRRRFRRGGDEEEPKPAAITAVQRTVLQGKACPRPPPPFSSSCDICP
jgi:hypothetical protein